MAANAAYQLKARPELLVQRDRRGGAYGAPGARACRPSRRAGLVTIGLNTARRLSAIPRQTEYGRHAPARDGRAELHLPPPCSLSVQFSAQYIPLMGMSPTLMTNRFLSARYTVMVSRNRVPSWLKAIRRISTT